MADPLPPTPFAQKLAAELQALHQRREREGLSDSEEARYAELWAWWQSGGGAGADDDADSTPPVDLADIPEAWVEAFSDTPGQDSGPDAPPLRPASDASPAAGGDGDELVRAWEQWQARRPEGDPFSQVPGLVDAPEPTEDEVLAARAEILGDFSKGVGALGEDEGEDPLLVEVEPSDDDGAAETAASPAGADAPPLVQDEESPPAAAEPPPAAAPEPAPPRAAQRVVIHLVDGQVRRGDVADLDVGGEAFAYTTAAGETETLAREDLRAIFFMRAAGAPPPQPVGRRLIVAFRDGRELAGTSADYEQLSDGFTLVPSDARGTAALVWIARSAVKEVRSA